MLQSVQLGRALPVPAAVLDAGNDLAAASSPTPRPHAAQVRLARRVLSGSVVAKHVIAWACTSLALCTLGTALAIALGHSVLGLGLGGLALGALAGSAWASKRFLEA